MDGGHIPKSRQARSPAPSSVTRRKPGTRPGLPISPNAVGRDVHSHSPREIERARRAADRESTSDDIRRAEEGAAEEAQTEAAEGAPAEQGELSPGGIGDAPGETGGTTDSEPQDGTTSGSSESASPDGTEVPRPRAAPASPIKKSKLPPIPAVPLPDLSGLRSPVVPPPPKSAEEKRFDILKSTGMLPANHHATVQRAVDNTAAMARDARSKVIFQTGTIAARARSRITNLSHEVPSVVGAGVSRIRNAARAAQTAIDEVTDRQIQAVIAKAQQTETDIAGEHTNVAAEMHSQLMNQATPALEAAKEGLNTELGNHLAEARQRIAGIKNGVEPEPFELNTPPEPSPEQDSDAGEDAPPQPPSPPTWDQAEADLSARLMVGNETNLTEFANLRVAASLPGMVNPIQESYDLGNDETADGLDSDETRLQMFNQTFDLIAPTQLRFAGHTERESDERYIGNLSNDVSLAYDRLHADEKRVVRQLDEKRTVLKEETLNPDHSESQPYKAIEGLQKAGKKVEEGILHQAATIEASLKSNLAALTAEYPGLVARLSPIVETGGFLEAAETLRQLAEAQESIGIMRDGQLDQIATQAELAYAQAQKGLQEQLDGLRKSARESCGIIDETQARVSYSIIQTGAEYTGIIDDGLADAIPQIIAHADRTARYLLSPDHAKDGHFSNLQDAVKRFINGVMAGEWSRYTAQLMGLPDQLGGIQTTSLQFVENDDKPMGSIRHSVVVDAKERAEQVQTALEPEPLSDTERLFAYPGAVLLAPASGGASVVALAGYEYASDPNENDIVMALAVPPPGPMAIEEAQVGPHPFRDEESLRYLIQTRMTTEGERADILALFHADPDVSRQAKNNLFVGSDSWGGISQEAAMSLMQSLGPAEIASSIMTPEENARMAQALEDTLDDPTDREIAAAYMNGEPDQALALKIRRMIDQQRGKEYNNQLQTGRMLDELVQRELAYGSDTAFIPPGQLDRMRNAAFLRFPEVTAEGRTPITIATSSERSGPGPNGPLTQGQLQRNPNDQLMSVDPSTLTSSTDQASDGGSGDESRMSEPPPINPPDPLQPRDIMLGLDAQERTAEGQRLSGEETNSLYNGVGELSSHSPETADEAAAQAATLRDAQNSVIAYMNRPTATWTERSGRDWRQRDLDRMYLHSSTNPQVNYDIESGKVTISPAAALQSYNEALIRHGSGHPITRGRAASATIARIPGNREPSENQINLLNDNFTDSAFNQMRLSWERASPRERANPAFRRRWEDAQRDHRLFLRTAAEGMIAGREDAETERKVIWTTHRPSRTFCLTSLAIALEKLAEASGRPVVKSSQKAGSISTPECVWPPKGWGTKRSPHAERNWPIGLMPNGMRGGRTARLCAISLKSVADDELSGDDWQDAREKLRGEDTDDIERAETLEFLINQQLEDGTGWLSSWTMADSNERETLLRDRAMVEDRLESAAHGRHGRSSDGRGADIPAME